MNVATNDRSEWVTSDIMARVLEDAFRAWNDVVPAGDDQRRTPRLSARDLPPLRIASYSIHGTDIECPSSARILDVSADGLRLSTKLPIPSGATVYFDLSSPEDEGRYGGATVVRCKHNGDSFDLGLQFSEDAGSLDVVDRTPSVQTSFAFVGPVRRVFANYVSRLNILYRVITGVAPSSVLLTANQARHSAMFFVEAKLTRFVATLFVDEREVASRRGPLNDRIRNLVSPHGESTMLQLSGAGFTGWAVLRPNAVTAYSLTADHHIAQHQRAVGALPDTQSIESTTKSRNKASLPNKKLLDTEVPS